MIWNGHELLVLPHFRNKGYPSVAQVWAQRFRLIRCLGVKKLQTMVFSMTQGGILPRFSWIVWCFEELWRDKSCMTKSSKTKPSEVPTFIQVVFFLLRGRWFPSSPYLMTFIHPAQNKFCTTHPGQGLYRGACTVYNIFLQDETIYNILNLFMYRIYVQYIFIIYIYIYETVQGRLSITSSYDSVSPGHHHKPLAAEMSDSFVIHEDITV